MGNTRYYIELEVLTPLSVGAGNENDWICGLDYLQSGNKVFLIDMEQAYSLGVDIERLASAFAAQDQEAIRRLLGNRLELVSSRTFDSPANTTNPIKAFLRTKLMDRPLVPGSSIKGAIRSCLFNDFHGHKMANEDTREINDKVFGTMKNGDVFTRFIHVGDVVMPQTCLVNTKLFNLQRDEAYWIGGWKHGGNRTTSQYQPTGFNTLYECVAPGLKGVGSIDITNNAFELLCKTRPDQAYLDKKKRVIQGGISALFHIINNTTRNYLIKEKEFFETFHTDRVDEIVATIDRLLSTIPDDDSHCVMKMSAGVGFHSITGDWIYEDYCEEPGLWPQNDRRNAGKKKYKSRKIAEYNNQLQLMGFVKLCSINETGESHYLEHIKRMRISEAQLKAEAAEEERRLEEQKAKERREKNVRRMEIEKRYDEILNEANALAEAEKWDDAIAKAQEAASVMPNGERHPNLIANWKLLKNIKEEQSRTLQANRERFCKPLSEILNPTSLGNVIGTTKKWVENNGGTFDETSLQSLWNAIQSLPTKERSKLHAKRKDVEKAIGKDWATKLFEMTSSN